MRLALGKIALEAGEHATAVEALTDLEQLLPLAKDEIDSLYARAAAVAGPQDRAAQIYERSAKVRDQVRAAETWLAAGRLKEARRAADTAVRRAEITRRAHDEEHAHAVRARIAERAKAVAVAAGDYRWLVVNGTEANLVREGIAGIDRLGGRLAVQERVEALAKSADKTNIEDTLRALDALVAKHAPEAAFIALGRARALYHARDYVRAHREFAAAAAMKSAWAMEGQYYAARSAVRAGRPDDALTRYQAVSLRGDKSPWGEHAALRRAELLATLGRHREAADAFARFTARYGRSPDAKDALYGRALALLSASDAAGARKLLTNLRERTDDRRARANLQHLEGVAALRAGDVELAKKLWLELIKSAPLTWPALAAHARLATTGYAPLPPLIQEPPAVSEAALPLELPEGPALFHSLGLDGLAEQRLGKMEQEAAERYAGRASEALCEMYGMLGGGGRRHQVGSRAVSLDLLMRAPTAAERWAWECVYPLAHRDIVTLEEQRHGLPMGLIHAIMRQESAFKRLARSPVGARGLMQLMPDTAARVATEIALDFDAAKITRPDVNVRLGAHYIAKLLGAFGKSTPLAVAAYNAGPQAVDHWLSDQTDREMDVWVARIPYEETRNYVERVMGNFCRYQYLTGGIAAITPLPLALPTSVSIGDDAY